MWLERRAAGAVKLAKIPYAGARFASSLRPGSGGFPFMAFEHPGNRWRRYDVWDRGPLRLDKFAEENPADGFSVFKPLPRYRRDDEAPTIAALVEEAAEVYERRRLYRKRF